MPCGDWAMAFLSECVLTMRGYSPVTARNSAADMTEVMEQIAVRQLALELQDRRCLAEARRNRSNKAPFRTKMLEHRRLQAQIAQLQRYRESALAHVDAVSNHKINQTFLRAIQGTVISADVTAVVEDLQESISSVREVSELLGQPMLVATGEEEATDDDLEQEFMEFTTLETITEAPFALPSAAVQHQQAVELRTAAFER